MTRMCVLVQNPVVTKEDGFLDETEVVAILLCLSNLGTTLDFTLSSFTEGASAERDVDTNAHTVVRAIVAAVAVDVAVLRTNAKAPALILAGEQSHHHVTRGTTARQGSDGGLRQVTISTELLTLLKLVVWELLPLL